MRSVVRMQSLCRMLAGPTHSVRKAVSPFGHGTARDFCGKTCTRTVFRRLRAWTAVLRHFETTRVCAAPFLAELIAYASHSAFILVGSSAVSRVFILLLGRSVWKLHSNSYSWVFSCQGCVLDMSCVSSIDMLSVTRSFLFRKPHC